MSHDPTTRWWPIYAAFIAGCLGAAQIGKVAAALSVVIRDLDLTLLQGGLVVSVFTVTTALTGALFGIFGDRFGHLRLAVAGLLISAAGSAAGSFSSSVAPLLATRLVEGAGFTLAVVCLPPLISRAASERDRPLAMGLWGAFMPGGMGLMMVLSPWLLDAFGWRGQWNGVSIALALWALILWSSGRGVASTGQGRAQTLSAIGAAIFRREPLMLFGCFAFYSAMYVPLTAFFTTMLVSQKGVALDVASWVGAPVVVANIAGNLAAGWLVRGGMAPRKVLALAFVMMGVCAVFVFLSISPLAVKVTAGILFSSFGGLIPGTLFTLAPGFAAHPAQIAALSGLLLQGAGIGQTIGPMMVSASVEYFGSWSYASLTMLVATLGGLLLTAGLARGRGRC